MLFHGTQLTFNLQEHGTDNLSKEIPSPYNLSFFT